MFSTTQRTSKRSWTRGHFKLDFRRLWSPEIIQRRKLNSSSSASFTSTARSRIVCLARSQRTRCGGFRSAIRRQASWTSRTPSRSSGCEKHQWFPYMIPIWPKSIGFWPTFNKQVILRLNMVFNFSMELMMNFPIVIQRILSCQLWWTQLETTCSISAKSHPIRKHCARKSGTVSRWRIEFGSR